MATPEQPAPPWKRIGPTLYVLWAAAAIGLAIAKAGLSAESVTRLLVLAFLLAQLLVRPILVRAFPGLPPKARFVLLGTLLAAVVEGFHMISKPVFASLTVGRDTPPARAIGLWGVDLLFTVPAYLVIFSVIWAFASRWRYSTWGYALVMGLAQTIGDGGLFFFAGNPALLLFLPYPMTNYHAINVLPYLAVRDDLAPGRAAGARAYLAIPAVIATYLVLGAAIKLLGRWLGYGG